jgi:ubiquitin-protein ligase
MSIAPDQLGDIYRQINDRFLSNPLISVDPAKGDPPNEYLLTYRISGLTHSIDGTIEELDEHKIELAIPFGFPHFPPSCKPKTDIYHPDFDPGAICIGEVWEDNPSLTDLIVRLGQMINGEFYSKENAFNNDAAEYYKDHASTFPLNKLRWDGSASPEEEEVEELVLDTFEEELEIEALEMGESLEEELSLDELFPSIEEQLEKADDEDFEKFEQYKKRFEYYALTKLINRESEPAPELEVLLSESQKEIRKGEELYKKAKELEHRGNATGALEKFKEVSSLVSDFPAIRSDIMRMEQTIDLLEDLSPEAAAGFLQEEKAVPEKKKPPSSSKKAKKPKYKKPNKVAAQQEPVRASSSSRGGKTILIAAGTVILSIAAGAGAAYFIKASDLKNHSLASSRYSECKTELEAGKFSVAKKHCDEGTEAAGKIRFFKRSESKTLAAEFNKLLSSKSMKFGLAGKILHDGKYRTAQEITLLKEIETLLVQADSDYSDKRYQAAADGYSTALQKVQTLSSIGDELIEELQLKYGLSRYQSSYAMAVAQTQKEAWSEAIQTLTLAQEIVNELPRRKKLELTDTVSQLLYLCKFEVMLNEGDTALNDGKWDDAVTAYNGCIDLSLTSTLVVPEKIERVKQSISLAELFKTIEKGNKAFSTGRWDDAINAYSEADNKLGSQQTISDKSGTDINAKRLSKIILRATIIRDKQNIKSLIEKGDNKQARDGYSNIVKLVDQSPLAGESEFKRLKNEIEVQIVELDQILYLENKRNYLESNYQALFQTNYPDAIPDNLSALQITLEEETDSRILFRVQCTEKGKGRPLTLVLHYLYNKTSGKWSLTSGGK